MAASEDRATSVLFRMSKAEKAGLVEDAEAAGITVQALLERRVLGKLDAVSRHGGRTPRTHQDQELPLTG